MDYTTTTTTSQNFTKPNATGRQPPNAAGPTTIQQMHYNHNHWKCVNQLDATSCTREIWESMLQLTKLVQNNNQKMLAGTVSYNLGQLTKSCRIVVGDSES